MDKTLLHILAPNLPLHRRTEGDSNRDEYFRVRNTMTNLMLGPKAIATPSLISSCDGTIDRLLLSLPAGAVAEPALASGYCSLIAALRPGTRFVVAHHQSCLSTIQPWFASHPSQNVVFVPIPDYVDITDWAEDAYVALKTQVGGPTYLMEPWEFRRYGDAMIADAVEAQGAAKASQAPLIFQGGNCLVGSDFWLLGRDYFVDSMKLATGDNAPVKVPNGQSQEAFVRSLFGAYVEAQRRLILVGTNKAIPLRPYIGTREGESYFLDLATEGMGMFQPIFHIDMFITLLGRNDSGRVEVMVGDPSLAESILGTRFPFALHDIYDRIAAELTVDGFAVTRNPLVHRATTGNTLPMAQLTALAAKPGREALVDAVRELEAAGAIASTLVQVRTWHHITWNNCLVENSTESGKHVYLPIFGTKYPDLAPIDAHMKAMWKGRHFTVHQLSDFNAFAERQGVVHCIKKYLDRGS